MSWIYTSLCIKLLVRGHKSVFYNSNHYPGLKFHAKNLGTAIIFSSGKYTIVGLKCVTDAGVILDSLTAAITHASIAGTGMRCANSVD